MLRSRERGNLILTAHLVFIPLLLGSLEKLLVVLGNGDLALEDAQPPRVGLPVLLLPLFGVEDAEVAVKVVVPGDPLPADVAERRARPRPASLSALPDDSDHAAVPRLSTTLLHDDLVGVLEAGDWLPGAELVGDLHLDLVLTLHRFGRGHPSPHFVDWVLSGPFVPSVGGWVLEFRPDVRIVSASNE